MTQHSCRTCLVLIYAAVASGFEYEKAENHRCGECGSHNYLQIAPYDQRWLSIDGSDPICDEALEGTKGSGYRGCMSKTVSGRRCQPWTAQTPHGHSVTESRYPHKGLGDHSFCRNPDGEPTIWCYTLDPGKRWEYCEPPLTCDEKLAGTKDSGYRGCQTKTVSGKTCQKWTSQSPQKHSRTPDRYKGQGLGDHNYCRNPDGHKGIWCYTTDPDKRWDDCAPAPVQATTATTTPAANTSSDDPVAVCKEVCDKSGSCGGFDVTKSGTCYFKRSTKCEHHKDSGRDCYTKVSAASAGGPGKKQISTSCRKGVCRGEDFLFFQKLPGLANCSESCFWANYKGHECDYFSYSGKTKYCLHYKSCDHVDTEELQSPANVFLDPGDLTAFSTCKFTVEANEKWVDLKGLQPTQASEGWGGAASRAVDGKLSANWGSNSCTHTKRHNFPWWEVKLEEATSIHAVRVLNRDSSGHRLDNFDVKVDGVVCASDGAGQGELKEVKCGLKGKTLTIESKKNEYLTICEVQVKHLEWVNISNSTEDKDEDDDDEDEDE